DPCKLAVAFHLRGESGLLDFDVAAIEAALSRITRRFPQFKCECDVTLHTRRRALSQITYGKLDEILRSFGFDAWVNTTSEPPARVYAHLASGAMFFLPLVLLTDHAQPWHVVGVRMTLDNFGIAPPAEFDRRLLQTT